MTDTKPDLPLALVSTDITRLNALRHGVLSRYTVLPWEDEQEYRAVVSALVAEHAPQGPTEEHLVEEVTGIIWRKRRLRLAEAAAHRRGLEDTLKPYRETVKAALVHLDDAERKAKQTKAASKAATIWEAPALLTCYVCYACYACYGKKGRYGTRSDWRTDTRSRDGSSPATGADDAG